MSLMGTAAQWSRLLTEAVSPFLEVFTVRLDKALGWPCFKQEFELDPF